MEREKLNYNVAIIGAGPAGLSAALKLKRLKKDLKVIVVEKSARIGENILSGAVLDPSTLDNVLTQEEIQKLPIECTVKKDSFYFLAKSAAFKIPFMPPYLRNSNLLVVSLGNVCKYLAELCEVEGVDIVTEFAASDLIKNGDEVKGIVIAPKGLDHEGKPMSNYYPGCEIHADFVIIAEGAQGYLAQRALPPNGEGVNPQSMVLILKELIELKDENNNFKDAVYHFFGYPHDPMTYGGAFMYSYKNGLVAIGVATGLDYKDPQKDIYKTLVDFKSHPFIKKLIGKNYQTIRYGAKLVPEGGWYSIPRNVLPKGLFIIGDSAGWVNAIRIKGIHLAIESGAQAAEAIFNHYDRNLDKDTTTEYYNDKMFNGRAGKELYKVRNIHQLFHLGAPVGAIGTGINWATAHLLPFGRIKSKGDKDSLKKLATNREIPEALDKSESVYLSGTVHREDQPCHCQLHDDKICINECLKEFGQPCLRFCPGGVYEKDINVEGKIFVNFSNCVHCKTCEIKCPKGNLTWTLPEGGEGPHYRRM